jgi:tricarballylate dehydrogenase
MLQPEGIAWAVFDAGLDDVENWPITVRSRVPPLESDTLAGFGRQMGVAS